MNLLVTAASKYGATTEIAGAIAAALIAEDVPAAAMTGLPATRGARA